MGGGGGQQALQTGPTDSAAFAAGQAQVNAAQIAAEAATQNTNAAIKALMNQYGTQLQYNQPAAFTGNQALAQLNYMLGMPAVAPGSAPVAPTAPTMQDALSKVTGADIHQEIMGNIGAQVGINGAGQSFLHPIYAGDIAPNWQGQAPGINDTVNGYDPSYTIGPGGFSTGSDPNAMIDAMFMAQSDPNIKASAKQQYASESILPQLQTNYQNDLTSYNQANDAYTNANNIYQSYKAKGTATSADIGDIVQNLPGFQFQQQQGIQGIQNAGSASGMLNSGALLQQLNQFGQGLASTYYGNYLGQLQGLAGMGQGATQNITAGAANLGNQMAGQYQSLGNNLGNAALAQGQAMATSYLSPLSSQATRTIDLGGGGGGGLGSALGAGMGLLGQFMGGF